MSQALAQQRCRNHISREAVCRCPSCGRFYCRECVTEHDERLTCSTCLRRMTPSGASSAHPARLKTAMLALLGFCAAWSVFYGGADWLASTASDWQDIQTWQER